MESDDKKSKPKLSLELNQEKQPKKKWLWQKIKEFFTQGPEGPDSQYWKNRDLND